MKDINGVEINPIWMAEFRGFFFGEGYIGITTNGLSRNKYLHYNPRIQITLRDDDISILKEIQAKLGGGLYREGLGRKTKKDGKEYQSKPYAVWRMRKKQDIERVLKILDAGYMPSQKRLQINTLRKFIKTVGCTRGPKTHKNQVIFESILVQRSNLHKEMLNLHEYIQPNI